MKITKKILPLILALSILFTAFIPSASAGWIGDVKARCDTAAAGTKAVIVYNVTDSQTLYVKNGTTRVQVGSITKVLTACVASQYFRANDILTVGSEQSLVKSYASRASVYSGQKYTFEQLCAAMLIPSGCDAAYAIAANAARKATGNWNMSAYAAISTFTSMMNDFCKKIGCVDSYWLNPDGQDISDSRGVSQHTTVNDYCKVALYAINNPTIAKVVGMSSYTCWDQGGTKHTWYTTNSTIVPGSAYYIQGAIGIKTGSTPYAGGCLLCAIDRNEKRIITLVTGTWYEGHDYSRRFLATKGIVNVIEPYLARRGDINDDGKIDINDARSALRIAIALDPFADIYVADLDLDGKITVNDARSILRRSIGLPETSDASEVTE